MSADHREVLERLGSYAIGALSEGERAEVEWHLRDCPSCSAELLHVRRVANRILDLDARGARLASGGPLRPVPSPPSGGADRLFGRLARERRRESSRRRWTTLSGLAAAAAVLIALVVVVVPSIEEEPDVPPVQPITFTVAPEGVTASAELRDWGWGTQMELVIDGLPGDQQLTAWLERPDGTRVSAGSFRSTGNQLTMRLGAGANTDEAVALGVSDAAGTTLLRAPLDS